MYSVASARPNTRPTNPRSPNFDSPGSAGRECGACTACFRVSILQLRHPPRSSKSHSLASRFKGGPSRRARRQVRGNYAAVTCQSQIRGLVAGAGMTRWRADYWLRCDTSIRPKFSPDLEARRLSRLTPRLQSVICTAVRAKRQNYC